MEFGEQVKFVRLKLHLSQTDFGKILGVSFTTVNRWETGKTEPNYKAMRAFEALLSKLLEPKKRMIHKLHLKTSWKHL